MVVARGWGKNGTEDYCFQWIHSSVWQDEQILDRDPSDGFTTMLYTHHH